MKNKKAIAISILRFFFNNIIYKLFIYLQLYDVIQVYCTKSFWKAMVRNKNLHKSEKKKSDNNIHLAKYN